MRRRRFRAVLVVRGAALLALAARARFRPIHVTPEVADLDVRCRFVATAMAAAERATIVRAPVR